MSYQVKIHKEEEDKKIYYVPLPIYRVGEGEERKEGTQKNQERNIEIKISHQQQGAGSQKGGEDIFPRKRKSDFHQ